MRTSTGRISTRAYILASTGILLIGVSVGMLWYWSLDDDDEEDEIEIKNTKPAPQKSDVYESKVEILTDPDDTNMKLVCLNF